jgi:hypothetical protein
MARRMGKRLDQNRRIGSRALSYVAAVVLFFGAVLAASAQTVPLGPRFVLPYQTVVDSTGAPIPGALLNFYMSGTNTRLNTYADPLLTTPNPNPVVANAAGVFPNIFLSGNYKVVLTDSSNNQIWTADPVYSAVCSGAPSFVFCGATTFNGTVTINPPSGTLNQGLAVNQTLPSSGSTSTFFAANDFSVTNPGYYASGPASTLDALGLNSQIDAVRVSYFTAGGISTSIHSALVAGIVDTGAAVQPVGLLASAYTNTSSSNGDTMWGLIGYGNVGPSGSLTTVHPIECEVSVASAATLTNRMCLSLAPLGAGSGSGIDAAIFNWAGNGASMPPSYGTTTPFKNFIVLDAGATNGGYGAGQSLQTSGNVFAENGTTFTTGSFVNLPNMTFSNYLFNFTDFAMSGAGHAVFGSGSANLPSSPEIVQAQIASGGSAQLLSSTNASSHLALDGFQAADSTTNIGLAASVAEASNNDIHFGQTTGGFAQLLSFGSSSTGMLLGTLTNNPLIIGTNNTFAGFINGSQQWSIGGSLGNTPASGTLLTLSKQSGVASPGVAVSGTIAQVVGANANGSAINAIEFDTFANGQSAGTYANTLNGVAYGGTLAGISATPSGAYIWILNGCGYDGANVQCSANAGAAVQMATTAQWSGSTRETEILLQATPVSSTTKATQMIVQGGVVIGGSGTQEGSGTLNIAGNSGHYLYAAGTAGVTCSGTPTSSFASIGGIITHC